MARFFDIGKEGERRARKNTGESLLRARRYEGQAARATMEKRGERNVPFYETNPFCFCVIGDVSS